MLCTDPRPKALYVLDEGQNASMSGSLFREGTHYVQICRPSRHHRGNRINSGSAHCTANLQVGRYVPTRGVCKVLDLQIKMFSLASQHTVRPVWTLVFVLCVFSSLLYRTDHGLLSHFWSSATPRNRIYYRVYARLCDGDWKARYEKEKKSDVNNKWHVSYSHNIKNV
jgi:hypothetical protein